MKNLLIDTNIYTHALAGDPETMELLRYAKKIAICCVSIGELLSGLKGELGKRRIEKSWKNS